MLAEEEDERECLGDLINNALWGGSAYAFKSAIFNLVRFQPSPVYFNSVRLLCFRFNCKWFVKLTPLLFDTYVYISILQCSIDDVNCCSFHTFLVETREVHLEPIFGRQN